MKLTLAVFSHICAEQSIEVRSLRGWAPTYVKGVRGSVGGGFMAASLFIFTVCSGWHATCARYGRPSTRKTSTVGAKTTQIPRRDKRAVQKPFMWHS